MTTHKLDLAVTALSTFTAIAVSLFNDPLDYTRGNRMALLCLYMVAAQLAFAIVASLADRVLAIAVRVLLAFVFLVLAGAFMWEGCQEGRPMCSGSGEVPVLIPEATALFFAAAAVAIAVPVLALLRGDEDGATAA